MAEEETGEPKGGRGELEKPGRVRDLDREEPGRVRDLDREEPHQIPNPRGMKEKERELEGGRGEPGGEREVDRVEDLPQQTEREGQREEDEEPERANEGEGEGEGEGEAEYHRDFEDFPTFSISDLGNITTFEDVMRSFMDYFTPVTIGDGNQSCILSLDKLVMPSLSDDEDGIEINERILCPLVCVVEDIDEGKLCHNRKRPFCDDCSFAGWGRNFVSKRKFHLIISTDKVNLVRETTRKRSFIEDQNHIFHLVFHINGYGHLLKLKGRSHPFGSDEVSGADLMQLLDRLCALLEPCYISVRDSSLRNGITLRYLHGVADGGSWFSLYGFEFLSGSYGVTEEEYNSSIENVGGCLVDTVLAEINQEICNTIVQKYRDASPEDITTLHQLFDTVLVLKQNGVAPPSEPGVDDLTCLYDQLLERPLRFQNDKRTIKHCKMWVRECTPIVLALEVRNLRAYHLHIQSTATGIYIPPPLRIRVEVGGSSEVLKETTRDVFSSCYFAMENFEVTKVDIKSPNENISKVDIFGGPFGIRRIALYEGGQEDWRVNCTCGATDDDGERMIRCDVCGIWQHTMCRGIDTDAVGSTFHCSLCPPTH